MGRLARELFYSDYYHVMTQGIGKSAIFKEETNKVKMCNIISESKEEKEVKLLCYCIMDNHMHLLISVPNITSMSEFMKRINIRYARYYNNKYDRVGYVFRDRFKSQPIQNEYYLMHCMRYIHNNPVKANIVEDLCAYKWSSYQEIINNHNQMVDKASVYRLFSMDHQKALSSFKEFHHSIDDDRGFLFIEDEEVPSQKSLVNLKMGFLNERNLSLPEILKDQNLLIEYVKYLKNDAKMSQRQIAQWIGLGRETLRKMLSISPSP